MVKFLCVCGGSLLLALPVFAQLPVPGLRAAPKPLASVPGYQYQPANPNPKPTISGSSLPRLELTPNTEPSATLPGSNSTQTTTERCSSKTVVKRLRSEKTDFVERSTTTTTTTAPTTTAKAAVFQMLDTVLRVDHCSVSKMTVTLYSDGKYTVQFRADQNPLANDPHTPRIDNAPRSIDTNQESFSQKRNLFTLTVRGHISEPSSTTGTSLKGSVLDLPVPPFWVQRGTPYQGNFEGVSEAVKRNFSIIERVEIDFTYR